MYVVKKPLNIRGKRRIIGEVIQKSDIDEKRVYSLVSSGYIARIDSGALDLAEVSTCAEPIRDFPAQEGGVQVNIPIIKKEGSMVISVAPEGVSDALRLIQTAASEAVKEIEGIDDENVLIILDACDSRKAIKEAVRNRAAVLHADEDDEEDFGSEGDS